jgi:hypothetical protein
VVPVIGRTHLATGCTGAAYVSAACATAGIPPGWALAAAVPVVIGSIAPDIDGPRSIITFSLGPVTMLLSWALRGMPLDIFGMHRDLLPIKVSHRGFTHRPEGWLSAGVLTTIATAFIPGPVGRWAWLWGIGMFLGCAVHVWGDAHTVSGVVLRKGGDPFWVAREENRFVTGSGALDDDDVDDGRPRELDLYWRLYRPAAFVTWIPASAVLFGWAAATVVALAMLCAWLRRVRFRRFRRWVAY